MISQQTSGFLAKLKVLVPDGIFLCTSVQRMATARARVLSDLRDGRIDASSPLVAVPYIGSYLEKRLRYSLQQGGGALTVGDVWRRTRRRTTEGVRRLLYRALQNERGNQCVATRVKNNAGRRKTYHTGDMNERGYEAVVALLEYNRSNATYGALPTRFPPRSRGSKQCGCVALRACNGNTTCRLSDDGQLCVPRSTASNGFVGVVAHQSQRENADNTNAVRRASSIRVTPTLRADPDSSYDLRARRSRRMSYSRRGTRLWRKPSTRVRHHR